MLSPSLEGGQRQRAQSINMPDSPYGPLPHSGHEPPGSSDWYPSPHASAGSQGQGYTSPYGPPTGPPPGAFGHPSANPPYGMPMSGVPGGVAGPPPPPPRPQNDSSGGGVVKWLVIGCLGCGGLAVFAFFALLLIGMLGGSGSGDSSNRTPSSTSVPAVSDGGGQEATSPDVDDADQSGTPDSDPPADSAAEPATPSGMSAEGDGASLTVTSTERTNVLRDSLWESETDDEFFVVDLSYTNSSNEAHTIWASDIVLVSEDGREFERNSDVTLALENPITIEDVNPGLTLDGTIVFEVPPGTEFTELRLEAGYENPAITIPLD